MLGRNDKNGAFRFFARPSNVSSDKAEHAGEEGAESYEFNRVSPENGDKNEKKEVNYRP